MKQQTAYEVLPIKVDVTSSLKSVNFYLVKTANTLTLVDAGFPRDSFYEALLETLHTNGLHLDDITEIVLTHNHEDHTGLVNRIAQEHPVPIYAHRESIHRLKRDPDFLTMRAAFYEKLYEEMGCGEAGKKRVAFLHETIVNNRYQVIQPEVTPIEEYYHDFQVIHTPGHAPDHIVLFSNETGELFAGDVLISHISSNAIVEPDRDGNRLKTLIQHKESMEKLKELNISVTYPGHGGIIKDTAQLIDRRLAGIDNKAAKFKNILAQKGKLTAAELAQEYYEELYNKQFSLVMSEIIGHLDYLEVNEEVAKEKKNGVWYYSAVN